MVVVETSACFACYQDVILALSFHQDGYSGWPPSLAKEANGRWWKLKGTALQLRICDCCYWDGVFPTIFQGQFDLVED